MSDQSPQPTTDASVSAPRLCVPVSLAERSYDILIGEGLLREVGALIRARTGARAVGIITDDHVAALHLPVAQAALAGAGLSAHLITIPAGEASKSWDQLGRVVDGLLAARLERGDVVLALGGGVVGDLAGFAAAITRRGMGFVQVPTTLLAQVDSSVGGKTAVNSAHGKNLVGAFYQPQLVLADTGLLRTLPLREFRAGYAELVKYGLLGDASMFEWLEAGAHRAVFAGGAVLDEAVRRACAHKAAIVARDETETGDRALLNLGHTFGHALEKMTGYDSARLVHGEAVAIGMAQAFRFSARLGIGTLQDGVRVERHLQAVGLPTRLGDIPGGVGDLSGLMAAIAQDKKVQRGALTFILARGIGQAFIARDVAAEAVEAFLAEELAEAAPTAI